MWPGCRIPHAVTSASIFLQLTHQHQEPAPHSASFSAGRQPVRVYMDGCFDVMHYGHANALRQARALGDQLVLGLISDDEIRRAKGPPVMDYKERKTLVGANKWVDEVIDGEQRQVLMILTCSTTQCATYAAAGSRDCNSMIHIAQYIAIWMLMACMQ